MSALGSNSNRRLWLIGAISLLILGLCCLLGVLWCCLSGFGGSTKRRKKRGRMGNQAPIIPVEETVPLVAPAEDMVQHMSMPQFASSPGTLTDVAGVPSFSSMRGASPSMYAPSQPSFGFGIPQIMAGGAMGGYG